MLIKIQIVVCFRTLAPPFRHVPLRLSPASTTPLPSDLAAYSQIKFRLGSSRFRPNTSIRLAACSSDLRHHLLFSCFPTSRRRPGGAIRPDPTFRISASSCNLRSDSLFPDPSDLLPTFVFRCLSVHIRPFLVPPYRLSSDLTFPTLWMVFPTESRISPTLGNPFGCM